MVKKILYLSCHAVLEYDELRLLNRMGLYVFSPGAYLKPTEVEGKLRPILPELDYDPEDVSAWNRLVTAVAPTGIDPRNLLTKEFVDRFDAVMIMHMPNWVKSNWQDMKHKTVIWRTIGQCIQPQEKMMQRFVSEGLKVVRYSPKERGIPDYSGEDALIRFYKDPKDLHQWTGGIERACTFNQALKKRGSNCAWDTYNFVSKKVPLTLFGPGNEDTPEVEVKGCVTYPEQAEALSKYNAYFYVGTTPASYTLNFIEAWMAGVPIISIGKQLGNPHWIANHDLFEIHELIENTKTGFVSDKPDELAYLTKYIINNKSAGKRISDAAREKAIEVFGEGTIRPQWESLLKGLDLL